MTSHARHESSVERTVRPASGFPMLAVVLAQIGCSIALIVNAARSLKNGKGTGYFADVLGVHPGLALAVGIFGVVLFFTLLAGFFVVTPNMGRVLVLFGSYRGSVREAGFYFVNPFTSKQKISLRAHNLNGPKLKVNDLQGNPIEIAAVVVWRVRETARAVFDVEKFEDYVAVQSESALRLVASRHPYDDDHAGAVKTTLRGSADEVSAELGRELQERLDLAGVEVIEARLSHLAYAAEIAAAMLQRQQAGAVIAARRMIVEGAVGMVEDALHKLREKEIVELDQERKATMVNNLLVVLCGHAGASPVVNAGSLYT
jgi:regulator of protease activity HflC (stomatin/prohibitin superfamily)